ncbi:hypothetical protein [Sedimentitalea arenosa]|uniref:Uncharacterized protein n=1 Tax=Sedimentitalea arenosa TaxID=2798803 RepID=A0A8J7IV14_9RHOB|nr:hypothetical protein [Arenibacterium arenosum]MBJ6373396.1 hypothetical protein [Arenibacterium arenosum]
MSEIADLKNFIEHWLQTHPDIQPVPPKKTTSRQVHLKVWRTRSKGRPIGLESGHVGVVNLWLTRMSVPASLPEGVEITEKVWKSDGWVDAVPDPVRKGRDGANSNLKPFEVFNTRPITKLSIRRIEEARSILEQVVA